MPHLGAFVAFPHPNPVGAHDAIQNLLEDIYLSEAVTSVFCDLSKAFNCVNHKLLLAKLESTQMVVSGKVRSSALEVQLGVLQRSVLG